MFITCNTVPGILSDTESYEEDIVFQKKMYLYMQQEKTQKNFQISTQTRSLKENWYFIRYKQDNDRLFQVKGINSLSKSIKMAKYST